MHVLLLSEFPALANRVNSERFPILCNRAPRNLDTLLAKTIRNLLI
jgi:hypothetical protein